MPDCPSNCPSNCPSGVKLPDWLVLPATGCGPNLLSCGTPGARLAVQNPDLSSQSTSLETNLFLVYVLFHLFRSASVSQVVLIKFSASVGSAEEDLKPLLFRGRQLFPVLSSVTKSCTSRLLQDSNTPSSTRCARLCSVRYP